MFDELELDWLLTELEELKLDELEDAEESDEENDDALEALELALAELLAPLRDEALALEAWALVGALVALAALAFAPVPYSPPGGRGFAGVAPGLVWVHAVIAVLQAMTNAVFIPRVFMMRCMSGSF